MRSWFYSTKATFSFIECRTAALARALSATLKPVDSAQTQFLRALGIRDVEALQHFRLTPLPTRRDMALL
eukprot:2132390-Alexandrium_andersonii.AAC.1